MDRASESPAEQADLRTMDGRVPGRRGRATRRRLLEVTADMLRTASYRDLAVVDIARDAGVSPATFYQYFPDVETAIFIIADHIATDGNRRLAAMVADIDLTMDPLPGCENLARGFVDLWREYRSIFRVLDLGAAEGDVRFQQRRTELLDGPTEALRHAIEAQQASGVLRHRIDAGAFAAILTAMLADVAAHRRGLRERGATDDDLVRAMGRVICMSLTDEAPRAPTG